MSYFGKSRLLISILLILTTVLLARLFYLQVISYNHYEALSVNVRSRVIPNVAPRGIIYDRNGEILATNKPLYFLYILPKDIINKDKVSKFLYTTCNIKPKKFNKIVNKQRALYKPALLKKFLSVQELSLIEENKASFPSLVIGIKITRDYPYGNVSSHLIGYTGEISAKELKYRKGYHLNDIVGLAGIERKYDHYLRGINGGDKIEVDSYGHPVRQLKELEKIPGDNLYLTIDIDLSKCIDDLMIGEKGAVVVLDPNSGETLSLISKPDFNPNTFTDFITEKEWQDIQKKDHPLHNRAITGYPPGSVFKPFIYLGALEEKRFQPSDEFYCNGGIRVGGRLFGCWKHSGHKKINLYNGLIHSCDVVFYNLGMTLGPKLIAKYATMFGLGTKTGIDLLFEGNGLIGDQKWKKKHLKQEWFPGDSLNMAIGQGFLLTSPIQLATAYAAIANGNQILYKPFIVKKIINPQNNLIMFKEPEVIAKIKLEPKNIVSLKKSLLNVVNKGTGINAKLLDFPIAGKTGTAETSQEKDHAWFISYAPVNDPELVIAVFLEHGGHGGGKAARISREIYKWWRDNRSLYAKK